jgi:hypothetical protein
MNAKPQCPFRTRTGGPGWSGSPSGTCSWWLFRCEPPWSLNIKEFGDYKEKIRRNPLYFAHFNNFLGNFLKISLKIVKIAPKLIFFFVKSIQKCQELWKKLSQYKNYRSLCWSAEDGRFRRVVFRELPNECGQCHSAWCRASPCPDLWYLQEKFATVGVKLKKIGVNSYGRWHLECTRPDSQPRYSEFRI